MKYLLFVFFTISGLGLVSCKEDISKIETEEQDLFLVRLLSDLYITETAIKKSKKSDQDSIAKFFNKKILSFYNLTEKQLDSTINDLQNDLNRYYTLSKIAQDSLAAKSKRKDELEDKLDEKSDSKKPTQDKPRQNN